MQRSMGNTEAFFQFVPHYTENNLTCQIEEIWQIKQEDAFFQTWLSLLFWRFEWKKVLYFYECF